MSVLKNQTQEKVLFGNLKIADGFFSRGIGLLGKKSLGADEALWLIPGNSVHTFFMKFSLAVIFVDKKNQVVKILPNLKPNKLVLPVWKAHSVIECNADHEQLKNIKVGDKLHVGH